jgi:Tfp pilus assembly protein PilF
MPTAPKAEVPKTKIARDLLVGTTLLVVVAFTYAPAREHDFVSFDDNIYVTQNEYVQSGLSAEGLRWSLTAHSGGNWHPLTWLSLMTDAELHGTDPAGFHRTNVLIHALNTLLVFWLLRMTTGARVPSALVAALFGLHPLHVESVAWVAERKDVLSTCFGLLTLIAYARWTRRPSGLAYAGILTLFGLSLMSKSMLVTLPFVCLLLDFWPLGRMRTSGVQGAAGVDALGLLKEKWPLFTASAIFSVLAYEFQERGRSIGTLEQFPFDTRVANALTSYLAYLEKTFWPSELAFFYPHQMPGLIDGRTLAAAGLLMVITTAAVIWRDRLPYLLVGWLWFIGTLIPVIGLVQIGEQSMADRYTYFPLIGVFICLVWLARDGFARLGQASDSALLLLTLPLLLAAFMMTRSQIATWSNDLALSRHALRVTRDNFVAHQSLGVAYEHRGHLQRALAHHIAAARIKPGGERSLNLANALRKVGDLEHAEREYRNAIALEPNFTAAHLNLATILLEREAYDEAIAHYEAALRADPNSEVALSGLAAAQSYKAMHDRAADREPAAQRQLMDPTRTGAPPDIETTPEAGPHPP